MYTCAWIRIDIISCSTCKPTKRAVLGRFDRVDLIYTNVNLNHIAYVVFIRNYTTLKENYLTQLNRYDENRIQAFCTILYSVEK